MIPQRSGDYTSVVNSSSPTGIRHGTVKRISRARLHKDNFQVNLVTYNIQYGFDCQGQYDLQRSIDAVRAADIICLQEVERYWERSEYTDQVRSIELALPDHAVVYGANLDVHTGHRDPLRPGRRLRRQFGNLIASRWPILSTRNLPLPKRAMVNQHSIQQGLLEAVIETPDGPLRVYTTHLSHLAPATRLPQVEAILRFVGRAPSEGGAWCGAHPDKSTGWIEGEMPPMPRPALITGDLNFDYRSEEYAEMIGPWSHKYGRLTSPMAYQDAWVAGGNDESSGATRPDKPGRIDHCLTTASGEIQVKRCRIDSTAGGSDHFPLWVEFELIPQVSAQGA